MVRTILFDAFLSPCSSSSAKSKHSCAMPRGASSRSTRMINYARDHDTADGLDYIAIWNASFLQNAEMREAMLANREQCAGDFVELPVKRSAAD